MKENIKSILILLVLVSGVIVLYNFLKDYWVMKGENNTKEYYSRELNEYTIKFHKEIAEKDNLLVKAVKEKIDGAEKHRRDIAVLENERAKEKEKTHLEFQELNDKLFRIGVENRNLKSDVLDLRATFLSFSTTNRELSFALNERETIMFENYNEAMTAAEEVVREQYIGFLAKIDRVKKMVKR